jgi:hypothetical protein
MLIRIKFNTRYREQMDMCIYCEGYKREHEATEASSATDQPENEPTQSERESARPALTTLRSLLFVQ